MFNEELFWLSFGDIITNIVTITVITGEVGLVIWLLLKWLKKNLNWSPVVNIGELSRGGKTYGNSPIEMVEEKKVKKNLGPVEVDIKKQITIVDADISDLKSDEVKKGKVKTQKDKLRSLRR
jgi:hypothetical protein